MTYHHLEDNIITYNKGIIKVKDLQIGDSLFGLNEDPVIISSITNPNNNCFEVTSIKSHKIIIGDNSIFCLNKIGGKKNKTDSLIFQNIKDFINSNNHHKHLCKLKIFPIEFEEKSLSIDPYHLGLLLGDGSFKGQINITTIDEEIINEIYKLADNMNLLVREASKKTGTNVKTYFFKKGSRSIENNLLKLIKEYDLYKKTSDDKFIPKYFLLNSKFNRLKLLAGLIDTDGHKNRNNNYDYISKSYSLARDIKFLANSLGMSAQVSKQYKKCQTGAGGYYYRLCISNNTNNIPVRVARKKSEPRLINKDVTHFGFNVSKIEVDPSSYIGFVTSDNKPYLNFDCILVGGINEQNNYSR